MFYYDYHCLIDNKRLRMHLLFRLYLQHNTYYKQRMLTEGESLSTVDLLINVAHFVKKRHKNFNRKSS
jgi:hypothetical protein